MSIIMIGISCCCCSVRILNYGLAVAQGLTILLRQLLLTRVLFVWTGGLAESLLSRRGHLVLDRLEQDFLRIICPRSRQIACCRGLILLDHGWMDGWF